MDKEFATLFLQRLRDLPLEEGCAYIQECAAKIADQDALGKLIKDEALRLRSINPTVSLKLAELLIFSGDDLGLPLIRALGLVARGDILEYFGNYRGALEAFDDAGKIFLLHDDWLNWAHSRIGWILPCAWLGRTDEALQQAAQAHEIFIKYEKHYWACALDHNTAVIYTQMGRYQKALELYERMMAIYPTVKDMDEHSIQLAIAMAKVNKARNLSWLGNFEQAYTLLHEAYASGAALGATGHVINTEFNLAELDYAQGYYGSALRRYYQVRDSLIQHNFDEPVVMASMTQRMAVCLVKLNRVQEARAMAADAVAACRQLGAALYTGDALREYAVTLIASGKSQEALTALEEAQALFSQGGIEHQTSLIKLQRAELLLETGNIGAAHDDARGMKAYFDEQGFVERSILASLVMINALIKMLAARGEGRQDAQWQEAMELSKEAARLARQHNLQELFYRSQHAQGKLALLQGDTRNASRHYRSAIAQIERILHDLVYDLSPSFLHTTWAVYEDMISLCLQQEQFERAFGYLERVRSITLRRYLNKSKSVLNTGKQPDTASASPVALANNALALQIQSELGRWQEKYHQYSTQLSELDTDLSPIIDEEVIRAELKRCETKISELFERLHLYEFDTYAAYSGNRVSSTRSIQKIQLVESSQLRQRLAPGQLMLAYYIYKDKLVIFALTAEGFTTHVHPEGAAQLDIWLNQLHAHLDPLGLSGLYQQRLPVIRRLLRKLYDLLIAPVSALLPPVPGFITVVPYGPLHKLPFHALFDGSHYLIEDFQINYLPVSSILAPSEMQKNRQVMHDADVDEAANAGDVGVPLEPEIHVPARSPLIFGYSGKGHLQRVLDEAKSLAVMLQGNCYLEDDATIARLVEQAPDSPIIHLATHGKNNMDAPNFSYIRLADGQLNAIDAFSLNLTGCELVTLSGCETGLAFTGGGDEQLGLGRAFLAGGAASLVMSLWPVEDNATNDLMQLFYQHLLRGETKAQALREAQCRLLHEPGEKYAHPYFWASFRLVGDIGPLLSTQIKEPLIAVKGVR